MTARGRGPLTWYFLSDGLQAICELEEDGEVVWAGLAFSLCSFFRASELFGYGDTGSVHAEFCLACGDHTLRQGSLTRSWQDRERADRVEVSFRASNCLRSTRHDKERRSHALATRIPRGRQGGARAVEIMLKMLEC